MNKMIFSALLMTCFMSGCDSSASKEHQAQALANLTCDSSREGRTKDELQAIGDACFRQGHYTKSSGKAW